ncbi:MAG: YggT family protein [Rhodothalassiaceae bacterium]
MRALLETLYLALEFFKWLVIIQAIMSWLIAFNVINTYNQVVNTIATMLYRLTEPALRPIRRFMPDLGGVDISPIILILIIFFLQRLIINGIY